MLIFSYFNSISKRNILQSLMGMFEVNWMLLMPMALPI